MRTGGNRLRVFAYGTLQRGEHNHRLLETARYVGPARTARAFTLYDLGPFPALVAGGSTAVLGEVYEVDAETLERLDHLEGTPRFYQRVAIPLELGAVVEAYVQRLDQVRRQRVIASGNWRDHRKERRCASE
jgi:gamma-glutamylaminecyclotransferase